MKRERLDTKVVFIDILTRDRYNVVEGAGKNEYRPRETNLAPFPRDAIIKVIYVDGHRQGDQTWTQGLYLEEETDVLVGILKYQAGNFETTFNQTWT
jgi:hypothetical protein